MILAISGKINVETRRVDLASFPDRISRYSCDIYIRFAPRCGLFDVKRTIIVINNISFFFFVKIRKIFMTIKRLTERCFWWLYGASKLWHRVEALVSAPSQRKSFFHLFLYFCFLINYSIPNHFLKKSEYRYLRSTVANRNELELESPNIWIFNSTELYRQYQKLNFVKIKCRNR